MPKKLLSRSCCILCIVFAPVTSKKNIRVNCRGSDHLLDSETGGRMTPRTSVQRLVVALVYYSKSDSQLDIYQPSRWFI